MRRNLENMLQSGQDTALLRYTLGVACLREDDAAAAVMHLRAALAQDAEYSAAWKELGRALLAQGDAQGAADAWQQGVAVAQRRGDVQAAKEMTVFSKRALRRLAAAEPPREDDREGENGR